MGRNSQLRAGSRGKVLVFLLALTLIACTMFIGTPQEAAADGGGHNDTLAIRDTFPELPPPGGSPSAILDVAQMLCVFMLTLL